MSNKIETGGYAYPVSEDQAMFPGMTLRQWYAGLAMQALISADLEELNTERLQGVRGFKTIVAAALCAADEMIRQESGAMLEARKQK